jgi:isochorismate synthase
MPFVLASPEETLVARGVARRLSGARDGLISAIAAHLESCRRHAESPVLVGALPFDTAAPAHLYEPQEALLTRGGGSPWASSPAIGAPMTMPGRMTAAPSRREFAEAVEAALSRIGTDGSAASAADPAGFDPLRKVVLARLLRLESPSPLNPLEILARLRVDRSVSAYHVPLPSPDTETHAGAPSNTPIRTRSEAPPSWRSLVGASPELLIRRRGLTVTSQPLAGSARRHVDARRDRAAADQLLASAKDAREHALVVEWIADRLSPYCTSLSVPRRPTLVSTSAMWHLATLIEGALRDPSISSAALAAVLHPTPAVCGVPETKARELIRELEPFDRAFFTGAVGWCAANGDGEWMVAIRCAEITRHSALLFAGAGIVAGSDPMSEVDETAAKFATMLDALGVDESELVRSGAA